MYICIVLQAQRLCTLKLLQQLMQWYGTHSMFRNIVSVRLLHTSNASTRHLSRRNLAWIARGFRV